MLTPILTVKTATPSAHVLAPEAVLSKEKVPVLPTALSGRQSEAALRILETINKQLLGSETLPKEALARLLDTLARLLKLPPLPQESLLGLSKRIAAAIEALPPAARLALEKQLGQRNLLLSARILAEIVKAPLPQIFSHVEMPQQLPQPRPANGTPRPLPIEEEPKQPQQPRPMEMPQRAAAVTQIGGNLDASTLQAALRSAFHAEEDASIGDTDAEDIEEGLSEAEAEHAAPASSSPAKQHSGDAIPTLRSMARFLADDALALSKVEAIAVGTVDPEIREALEHALEADTPLELPFSDDEAEPVPVVEYHVGEHHEEVRPQQGRAIPVPENASIPASVNKEHPAEPRHEEERPQPTGTTSLSGTVKAAMAEPARASIREGGASIAQYPADDRHQEVRPQPVRTASLAEIAKIATADPAKAAAKENTADQFLPEAVSQQLPQPESKATDRSPLRLEAPPADRSARLIADALKVLIEVGLPLTGEELDAPAEVLFALAAVADIEAVLDEQVPFRATHRPAEEERGPIPSMPEIEPDDLETGSTPRETLRNAALPTEERPREPLPQRLPETILPREVPAFVAVPYPPAKSSARAVSEEEEEPQSLGHGEGNQSHSENPDDDEAGNNARDEQAGDEEGGEKTSADAYDLYRRLGGIG